MYNVYLSQRRASSYLDGCRIFAVRVNLLVLTRPNLANNYRNSSVDFFHVQFVIVIVLVIQVLFRSNCTFYLSSFCISVLVRICHGIGIQDEFFTGFLVGLLATRFNGLLAHCHPLPLQVARG